MREQAHIIQQEVAKLMDDVGRLDERVRRLATHFSQANKDIEEILTSSRRISGRGEKIRMVEVEDGEAAAPAPAIHQPATRGDTRRGNAPPQLPFSQFEEVPAAE
jgi:DNA recombination protein RmuC